MVSFLKTSCAFLALAPLGFAGKTTTVSNWGDNPSKLPAVIVYTPDKLAEKPAVVLALHPCGGSGSQYRSMVGLDRYADQLGFVVLYPTSNAQQGFNCWDCHSTKSLKHDGGGDSQGLAAMAKYALKTYNGDASKVFTIGGSSGAMESNVLAATYPDVFKGAVSYSGVPAACWAGAPFSTPLSSDTTCPLGQKASRYTQKQWIDLAKSCDPGYNGTYPKMMIVHGTADTAVTINNLKAQLDQWSGVKGLSFTKNETNNPTANWKKIIYGDGTELVGYEVQGGGHIPAFQGDATLKFLGLM